MTLNARILDLLLRWEEGCAQGTPPTPEELCHDCPELLPEIRQHLQQREKPAYLENEAILTPPPPTTVQVAVPDSSRSAAPPPGPRYRRLRFHAKGGLGEVYVGFDQELRREVALKRMQRPLMLFPEAQRRFLREAEVTGRLEHPGIVPVYGLVQDDDGMPCYAMRFIQGESLQDAIQRFHQADQASRDPGERSLAFRELLTRFAAVCKTLAYAHSRGILHRDIKPANIMLGKYGETLVVDWGLARPVARTEQDRESGEETLQPAPENATGETRVGQAVGTPVFMSPEQAAGRWDVIGPASDLYSLGATLYTLLTGQDPFTGSNHAEVLQKVQQGEFSPPRQVKPSTPPALQATCLKAMARKPEDRYATALELAEEVEHWLADEPVRAYREPLLARARRWRRRHKALVTGLTTLVLTALVLGGGGGYWLHRQAAERQAEADRHRRAAEQALDKVPGLLKQWRWQEAETILDDADSHLEVAGPADLRARLAQARDDLKLARKLDAIRLEKAGRLETPVIARQIAVKDYAQTFAEAGLAARQASEEEVAAWVRISAIREQVVAALDEWAMLTEDLPLRCWLLGVARRADPDDWRDRFRDPQLWQDRAALQALANELLRNGSLLQAQSPTLLAELGHAVGKRQGNAVPLLTAACRLHPDDFWLNHELGYALFGAKRWEAAAGYYRAALAVRPGTTVLYNNLGAALLSLGQADEAVKDFQLALARNAEYAIAHNGLGVALYVQGHRDEAVQEYHRALKLDPNYAMPHFNLGNYWRDTGKINEAIHEYHRSIELDPHYAPGHVNLGLALGRNKEQLDEAVREMRTALDLDPENAETHCNLGFLLGRQGKLTEALAALRQGHKLGSAQPGWRHPSADWIRQTERIVELDRKLPALLQGKEQPANNAERLEIADLCQRRKQLYTTTVRFYTEAFAHDAKLADQLQKQYRYNAACAAALAGCGQGKDADKLREGERAQLRRQALEWLRADLALWAKQTEHADDKVRAAIQQTLKHWQTDTDLVGIRDKDALEKLPEAERHDFRKLWDDVAALLTKVASNTR